MTRVLHVYIPALAALGFRELGTDSRSGLGPKTHISPWRNLIPLGKGPDALYRTRNMDAVPTTNPGGGTMPTVDKAPGTARILGKSGKPEPSYSEKGYGKFQAPIFSNDKAYILNTYHTKSY